MTRNRADAEDLVHDAAVNALAAWSTFKPGSNFNGWMYRILRNQFTFNRMRQRETQQLENVADGLLTRPPVQDNGLLLQAVWRSFAQLTPDQRQAIMLVAVQELSYEEAADAVGCPVGTMKSRVSRARRILAAWLHGNAMALHKFDYYKPKLSVD